MLGLLPVLFHDVVEDVPGPCSLENMARDGMMVEIFRSLLNIGRPMQIVIFRTVRIFVSNNGFMLFMETLLFVLDLNDIFSVIFKAMKR